MKATQTQQEIIGRFFKAMQAGKSASSELMALFAPDAVMTEPFHGEPQTHHGTAAIRESFGCVWEEEVPDLKLEVNRIDLDGPLLRAEWTCTAPAFPSPIRGYDRFEIRDGKITKLEIFVTESPNMATS